jgi:hypothetical protein
MITFIIRSAVQILTDHPCLYWTRHSTPGKEWFRFQNEVPPDPLWTAKQDSVNVPGWIGIPGLRHSIGRARAAVGWRCGGGGCGRHGLCSRTSCFAHRLRAVARASGVLPFLWIAWQGLLHSRRGPTTEELPVLFVEKQPVSSSTPTPP